MENEVTNFNFDAWRERFDNKNIQQDKIEIDGETYLISTVDLCIPDDEFYESIRYMPPYETMIFDSEKDIIYIRRYYDREVAHEAHKNLVAALTVGQLDIDDILD